MTRGSSRVVLALSVLVAVPLVYAEAVVISGRVLQTSGEGDLLFGTLVGAAFLVTAWVAVWQSSVKWTRHRVVATIITVGAAMIPAAAVYALHVATSSLPDEVGLVLAGVCWAAVWLGGTAFIWRETRAERVARLGRRVGPDLPCPKCGYNLRGLREARCPECGTQYTLDELLAALAAPRRA